jgi:hypothetical protein
VNIFNSGPRQKNRLILAMVLVFCTCALIACSGSKNSERAKSSSPDSLSGAPATSAGPGPGAGSETTQSMSQPETSPAEPGETEGKLDNYFSAIEDTLTRIPRDTFDPEAIVQKAGRDPVRLFEWVRDETNLVPYQGSLRGPVGVLMDRRGNSLDRALLAHELLRLAGNEVRLASGQLSPEKAQEVYRKSGSEKQAAFNQDQELSLQDQKKFLEFMVQKYQLQEDNLPGLLAQSQEERQQLGRELSERAKEQTSDLLQIVKDQPKAPPEKQAGRAIEALVNHWWVQWEKDGEWVDLDPTFPNLRPGDRLVEAEDTCAPEDIEEGLFHAVVIRAIAEQWKEGQFEESTILEHRLVPSALIGKPIVLRQLPLDWPSDEKLFGARNPMEALKTAVLGQKQWKFALEIDGQAVAESYLDAQGEVTEEPTAKGSKKDEEGGPAGGLLGGLAGGEGKKSAPANAAYLTAEWLEYEVHSPGQPVRSFRREVFDLLGPSARGKGAPAKLNLTKEQQARRNFKILGQTEFLPLFCRLSPAFIETLAAENMLLDREFYLNLEEEYRSLKPQDLLTQISELRFLRGELYGLALKRFEFSAQAADTYLESPNLFAFHSSFELDEKGELLGSQCLDIVSNDVAVSPAAKEDPFRVQLGQGVLDTVLEAQEMSDQGRVNNTALIFAESKAQKINWLLIKNSEDPNWGRVQMPPDMRIRIEKDLAAGYWDIAPVQQIEFGGKPQSAWWRLNPETGNILGLGENSMGQAMTQYAVKVNIVLQLKTAIQIYADIMRCMATAITSPLRGTRPQNDEQVIKCIWDVVCKNAHKAAGKLLTIEVNWTNIIISQTISWAMGKLCAGLWQKGINR